MFNKLKVYAHDKKHPYTITLVWVCGMGMETITPTLHFSTSDNRAAIEEVNAHMSSGTSIIEKQNARS